jgi:hypothetical protein
MILNLSIGEEIEQEDAKELEGKSSQPDDEMITTAGSQSGDMEPEKPKDTAKATETTV